MSAKIIDGVEIAQRVRADWKPRVEQLRAAGVTPGLAVIMVGENPASKVYVRNKVRACRAIGIHSEEHLFDESAPCEASKTSCISPLRKRGVNRSLMSWMKSDAFDFSTTQFSHNP